jgi:hypothetical protein
MSSPEPEVIEARRRGEDPRLAQFALLAHLMDRAFRVPGTSWRFGLDALVGLFPGVGDILGSIVGAYGIWIARQMGAPASVQLRMTMNLAIDGIVGLVPIAGDLFDFGFKAHTRNQALLARWLETPHRTRRSSIAVVALAFLVLLAILVGAAWVVARVVGWLLAQS